MTLFALAYAAGVLTIATPCILPVLPFVLARSDAPFVRSGLPLLLGLAAGFAAVASLASAAGGWAIAANQFGRVVGLSVLALFGLSLIVPRIATAMAAPLTALGSRLTERRSAFASSLTLGIATGLIWAPCAGPVLGLILTGAALHGPGVETSLLLLVYALGAATPLGAVMAFGGRGLAALKRTARVSELIRQGSGVAVILAVGAIALGLDVRFLTPLSAAQANAMESHLISNLGTPHAEASAPALPRSLTSLVENGQWLNGAAVAAEDLRGKVILVNFWTYSCINCLRTLPYIRSWNAKYKDHGLVVIGVHTPEFAFEKDAANVARAAKTLGVSYPVTLDNNFRIWRAFDNEAWPALFFFGADGRLRHQSFGEGDYDLSERAIQRLLAEAGAAAAVDQPAVDVGGTQVAPDPANLRSPESYIGYDKAENFAAREAIARDIPQDYRPLGKLPLNAWSLSGRWTVGREFATLDQASGRIAFRFHARDLHLVLAAPSDGHEVRFRVTIDGAAPAADHGSDTDAEGIGTVTESRLYQLVRQAGAVKDRTFEIEFLEPGIRAYAFTFG